MKSKQLKIEIDQDHTIEGMLTFSPSPPWVIEFTSPVTTKFRFVNNDLFECLVDLRQELAKQNYLPLCNGARENVYPSPMSRDMGGGRMAYILKLGKQAKQEDLVDIFDYTEPTFIVSVDEQKNFYRRWIESLK